jgi:hypothetical protein
VHHGYAVLVKRAMWQRFARSGLRAAVDAATDVRDNFLHVSPLDDSKAPGKTKKLEGRFAGMIQYDLPAYHRLWYSVDEEAMQVRVHYVGVHPERQGP